METLIKRLTWFGLSAIGSAFLGISVLFSILGIYVLGVDIAAFFKWILVIFLLGTGIISGLIFLGALCVGLVMRFSKKSVTSAE